MTLTPQGVVCSAAKCICLSLSPSYLMKMRGWEIVLSTVRKKNRFGGTDECFPKACINGICSMVKKDLLLKLNAIKRNSAKRYVLPEMTSFYNW